MGQRHQSHPSTSAAITRVARRSAASVAVTLTVIVAVALVAFLAARPALAATKTAPLWLSAPATTVSGHDIAVGGGIAVSADLSGATVKIYKREVGQSSNTLVAKVPVTDNVMTGNIFSAVIPAVKRNCLITAVWAGNADYGASSTWMFAGVKPKLKLTVLAATAKMTKLRCQVTPRQPFDRQGMVAPPFIAIVQCRQAGHWTTFPGELSTAGTNGESWCAYSYYDVQPGTLVLRVRFIGTNYNVACVSKPVSVTIN